jgi:hypothetical protein
MTEQKSEGVTGIHLLFDYSSVKFTVNKVFVDVSMTSGLCFGFRHKEIDFLNSVFYCHHENANTFIQQFEKDDLKTIATLSLIKEMSYSAREKHAKEIGHRIEYEGSPDSVVPKVLNSVYRSLCINLYQHQYDQIVQIIHFIRERKLFNTILSYGLIDELMKKFESPDLQAKIIAKHLKGR